MATSRLERIGTIYSRITGLLRSEALKPENKPIWYDVYQNFPPKYAPKFDRPIPKAQVQNIFYPEDIVRARIHKEKSSVVGTVTLSDTNRPSTTQRCIAYYNELKEECGDEQEALEKAVERAVSEIPMRKETSSAPASIADEFKRSKSVNVADIFKE